MKSNFEELVDSFKRRVDDWKERMAILLAKTEENIAAAQLAASAMAAFDFGASVANPPKSRSQLVDEERAKLEAKLRRMFPRIVIASNLFDYACKIGVYWQSRDNECRWQVLTKNTRGASDDHFAVARRILDTAYPYPRYQP